MNTILELVLRSILIGIGATLVMDGWAAILRRFGVPSLNFALLGRWVGHLLHGQWFHQSISNSAPIARELLLGWCAHYAIGVAFATLTLAVFALGWAHSPTLRPALLMGVVTVVAPLFLLQPALGAGVLSAKTRTPVRNSLKSLMTHIVFGVGLFLAARATASLIPEGG